jgi:hypothetical protein
VNDGDELRRYYASLGDEALAEAVAEGEAAYQPAAWRAIQLEVIARRLVSDMKSRFGDASDLLAEPPGALPVATVSNPNPIFVPSWSTVLIEVLVAAAFLGYRHWVIGGLIALGALNGIFRRAINDYRKSAL